MEAQENWVVSGVDSISFRKGIFRSLISCVPARRLFLKGD